MINFLPPARPSTPVAVYLNVLPGEARQSIQAFSWLGIPKLYIGAPSTTMSAARNSSSTTLVSANSACVDASTLGTTLHGGSHRFDNVAGQRSGLVQRLHLGE